MEMVHSAIISDRLSTLDAKLDLIYQKEKINDHQLENIRKERALNVIDKDLNKAKWQFGKYLDVFDSFEYGLGASIHTIAAAFLNRENRIYRIRTSLLPTILVRLECNGITYGPVRALLDSGAHPNIIDFSFFKKLSRPLTRSLKERVVGIEGQPLEIKRSALIRIRPWFESDEFIDEEYWILPKGNSRLTILPAKALPATTALSSEYKLADPNYHMPSDTPLLLGIRIFSRIISAVIGRDHNYTTLLQTTFGVVVMGPHPIEDEVSQVNSSFECQQDDRLDELLQRLWEMDRIKERGSNSMRTMEQELVEQHFIDTHYRDGSGRFVVSIPIKTNISKIGSSRETALRRFFGLERKLESNSDLKQFYVEQMEQQIELGYMQLVTRNAEADAMIYHIPHHFVAKKPRVVYDASCRTNHGMSLNDIQMNGEKMQKDLFEIIRRFRRHRVTICADIRKMFHQICLNERQWDLQRIFWRENSNMPLKEYWMTRITFGLKSSPYLAVRCVIQAAREARSTYPKAADALEHDFYMDDCATGAENEEDAIQLAKEMETILDKAGFKLCKWSSNSETLLQEFDSDHENSMVFSGEEKEETTILGLKLLFAKDQFTFEVKTPELNDVITKRKIVSQVAQWYDPEGYISPVIVVGKRIIQDLWKLKLDWDEKVPKEMAEFWMEFRKEMGYLKNFRLDRWLRTSSQVKIQLIGFSDSSQIAYGAVLYVRVEHPDGKIECTLLNSKSRVAPLKPITIPRLELAGAELMSKLLKETQTSMDYQDVEYWLFVDSSPVLYWIRKSPSNLKTYVAHRVSDIQERTDIRRWKYVNTKENPADLLSRGVRPRDLVANNLWLHGPAWLSQPMQNWPAEQFPYKESKETEVELKEIEVEMKVFQVTDFKPDLDINIRGTEDRVSLLEYVPRIEQALNILSYVKRYFDALRSKKRPLIRSTRRHKIEIEQPTEQEKAWALQYFSKKMQEQYFNKELTALRQKGRLPDDSRILPLRPLLDSEGLMRVGGRLDASELDYETKHPVIIPHQSKLAELWFEKAHRHCKHGGVQQMMHYLRQECWITKLRNSLRQSVAKCVMCFRHNHRLQMENQIMGDLPADRVTAGKVFWTTGVDYAGPFTIQFIDEERKPFWQCKVWIAIFVCLKTRAVHIDMISDLTSIAFLSCYQRFINRRGRCRRMYSDNGTSFVGAEKEIRKAYERWFTDETLHTLAQHGTEWKFMTPAAPHQGGIYEAAVKSMKFHLKRVIGSSILTHEQLNTLLVEIEGVMNSRPLHPLTDDPQDYRVLTPGHFLVMEPIIAPPSYSFDKHNDKIGLKLFNERQRIFQHFWKRWSEDYLTSLQQRKKWRHEKENIKVGQLVLLKAENFPPSQWAMGRIIKVLPDKNGHVRNVIVQTQTAQLHRAIQKLAILPVDTSDQGQSAG